MRIDHQIKAFNLILADYDGLQPLSRFLPIYFKKNKQMGSTDRRWATRYIYSYFRLGQALKDENQLIRLAVGDFLVNDTPSLMIEHHLIDLRDHVADSLSHKIQLISTRFNKFNVQDIFSYYNELSSGIEPTPFATSFLIQPDLFLRVKSIDAERIKHRLSEANVAFKELGKETLSLSNGTKLDQVLPDQKYYQVQDLSSQRTGNFFRPNPYEYWWDCCAASGGKSLLLHDLQPTIQLLVSDVREKSLFNLDERFRQAGLKKYQKKVLDLLQNNEQDLHRYEFDGIIVDAPCSGSGTWGRTPETMSYFERHRIGFFSQLQKNIVGNVINYLKPGKPLIYITCSVFKSENEEVVQYITDSFPLKLESMELINGYSEKADTMFVARLIKK